MRTVITITLFGVLSVAFKMPQDESCLCGLAKRKDFGKALEEPVKSGIMGGKEAEVNEYPWMVALSNGCGGSLITNQWVLTAGHCLENEETSLIKLDLGDHNKRLSIEARNISKEIEQFFVHPRYENSTPEQKGPNYDFALIKLKTKIDWSEHPNIRPICLPYPDETYAGKTAIASGWGAARGRPLSRGPSDPPPPGPRPATTELREVDIEVLTNKDCAERYSSDSRYRITDAMLCAISPGKDSCNGDSGGPLVVAEGDGETPGQNYRLVGVVSYGDQECGHHLDRPGVYARVTEVLPWIHEKLKADNAMFCPASTFFRTDIWV